MKVSELVLQRDISYFKCIFPGCPFKDICKYYSEEGCKVHSESDRCFFFLQKMGNVVVLGSSLWFFRYGQIYNGNEISAMPQTIVEYKKQIRRDFEAIWRRCNMT